MDVNEHEKLFTIILRNNDCIAIQHLTVAVGYSTMSTIRTRIHKSKKDKTHNDQKKGQKDKRTNNDQQNIRIGKLLNQWFLLVKVEVNIFNVRTVVTMIWLNATKYLCQKWPRVCSTCRKHFLVPSPFMTYHWVCSYIKMTTVTTGAELFTLCEHRS